MIKSYTLQNGHVFLQIFWSQYLKQWLDTWRTPINPQIEIFKFGKQAINFPV